MWPVALLSLSQIVRKEDVCCPSRDFCSSSSAKDCLKVEQSKRATISSHYHLQNVPNVAVHSILMNICSLPPAGESVPLHSHAGFDVRLFDPDWCRCRSETRATMTEDPLVKGGARVQLRNVATMENVIMTESLQRTKWQEHMFEYRGEGNDRDYQRLDCRRRRSQILTVNDKWCILI